MPASDEIVAIDANALPWEERYNEHLERTLYREPDPGPGYRHEVRPVRYRAGVSNTSHTHPCAHGMYVLEGMLVTHAGRFGPGSFVWFPEGCVMDHGAAAEADVTMVFITNKPFEIIMSGDSGGSSGTATFALSARTSVVWRARWRAIE